LIQRLLPRRAGSMTSSLLIHRGGERSRCPLSWRQPYWEVMNVRAEPEEDSGTSPLSSP